MPYALRIKFPGGTPQAPRTLSAERGLFTLSGRASNGITYVPPTVDDQWTKLSSSSVIGQSPSLNNGWWKGLALPTGEYFIANEATWFFNPNTGTWRKSNTVTTDWRRNVGFRENYDLCYDADRDVVWLGVGGPVGWGNAAGPVFGDMQYSITEDVWRNVYPASTGTYSALPADVGYFITGNKGLGLNGFDSKYAYFAGYLYKFGNFSLSDQNLVRLDPSVAVGVNGRTTLTTTNPPWNTTPSRDVHLRSGLDYTGKRLWTLAANLELYTYDLTPSAVARQWVNRPSTGTKPSVPVPGNPDADALTSTEYGMIAELDEEANALVVWCGVNGNVVSSSGTSQRKTWVLDWGTLQWRTGPSAAGGHTVPTEAVAVSNSLNYNAARRSVQLAVAAPGTYVTELWEFKAGQNKPGKITSIALPSFSGSVYGVNYNKFPYLDNSNSKHTNMAYCPSNGRLYVTGGDTGGSSATDGIWSMSLDDGSWRLDAGKPVYPTFPAPSAYQDNEGFEWCPSRNSFLFWPGSGTFGYSGNVFQYGEGFWWFDPTTNLWTQDTRLFTGVAWTTAAQIDFALTLQNTTGMIHGGVYDAQTDIIYASTSTSGIKRYDMATGTQLATVSFVGSTTTPIAGYTGVYWSETKWQQVGRWVFMPTALYNGVNYYFALAKFNIDSRAFVWCALPPMPTGSGTGTFKEQRIGVSGNTIVWPKTVGPDGVISGIYLYDIDADTWQVDNQVPGYGNMLCNAITSLPDGRVAFSGGVFGPQMTHIWFYEVF